MSIVTNRNFCADGFPFSISVMGCFVCIENGAQGLVKIRQEFMKVPTCPDGKIITLCDGSDESPFLELYDISTLSGNYAEVRICLLPSDFGFDTKAELFDALAMAALTDIRLLCCAGEDPFRVSDNDVFCNDDGDAYGKCSEVNPDLATEEVTTYLITSLGRIPLPANVPEHAEYINQWIAENGLQGEAIQNPNGAALPVFFQGINFSVYEVIISRRVLYVAGDCIKREEPSGVDRRQGVTPIVPDDMGLMKSQKVKTEEEETK